MRKTKRIIELQNRTIELENEITALDEQVKRLQVNICKGVHDMVQIHKAPEPRAGRFDTVTYEVIKVCSRCEYRHTISDCE